MFLVSIVSLAPDTVLPWISAAVIAYLLGSLNTAVLVSRLLRQEDVRTRGSGNAGATNMLRLYGRLPAGLTLLGDFLKTVAGVLLARLLFRLFDVNPGLDAGYYAGWFVMLGHVFPVWFGFRGGKGVLVAAGVVLLVDPLAFIVLLASATPIFLLTRTMSVVSLAAAGLLPVVTLGLGLLRHVNPLWETLFTLAYAVLVVWSHRKNIRRLRDGAEKPVLPRKTGL